MSKAILCIGIDEFDQGAITPLSGAAQDAQRWAAFFEHKLGFTSRVLTHANFRAGARIFNVLDELLSTLRQPGDQLGIFIATHGKQMPLQGGSHDQLFLLPHARLASIDAGLPGDGALSMRQLAMETAREGLQRFFIIDACRAPLTVPDAKRESRPDFGAQGQVVYRDMALSRPPPGQQHNSPLLILNACADSQRAGEVRSLRRGMFSLAAEEVAGERLKAGVRLNLDAEFAATVGARMRQLAHHHHEDLVQDPVIDQGGALCLWDPDNRKQSQWDALRSEFDQQLDAGHLESPPGQCARETLAALRSAGLPADEYRPLAERLATAQGEAEEALKAARRAAADARLLAAAEEFDSEAAWLALWTGAHDQSLRQRARERLMALPKATPAGPQAVPPTQPDPPPPEVDWLSRADIEFRVLGDVPTDSACQAFLDSFPHDIRVPVVRQLQAQARHRNDMLRAFEALGAEPEWAACDGFLTAYPDGQYTGQVQALQAQARDRLAWQVAQRAPSLQALAHYLEEFPQGQWAAQARQQQLKLQQDREDLAQQAFYALGTAPSLADCDRFLSQFADTTQAATVRNMRRRAHDNLAWEVASRGGTVQAMEAYLAEYPSGEHAEAARREVARLHDDLDWDVAERQGTLKALESYLSAHPSGEHVNTAQHAVRQLQEKLDWDAVKRQGTLDDFQAYLSKYPSGKYVQIARQSIQRLQDDQAWALAEQAGTATAMEAYLEANPNGSHAEAARHAIQSLHKPPVPPSRRPKWAFWLGGGVLAAGVLAIVVPQRTLHSGQDAPLQQAAASAPTAATPPAGAASYATLSSLPVLDGRSATQMAELQRQAAEYQRLAVVFRDPMKGGGQGPDMVVIPGGQFTMGSSDEERKRYVAAGAKQEWADWDKPRAGVTVPAYALGRHEVTRGEFAAFVKATGRDVAGGCWHWDGEWKQDPKRSWLNPGFAQTDEHPVVCVSWQDAEAYSAWLAAQTGKGYRLPSEAEWELAARAGTTTRRWWGDDPSDKQGCAFENVADHDHGDKLNTAPVFGCRDGHVYTAPVGKFKANWLGLNDMLGNASEWVQDCFDPSHDTVPADGSARKTCSETRRVVRGGAWDNGPRGLRSAIRYWVSPGIRYDSAGFRLARTF